MPRSARIRRHDLIYLSAQAAEPVARSLVAKQFANSVIEWIEQGRPFVATRQNPANPLLLLGVTLPQAWGRPRLLVQADLCWVEDIQPPLAVAHLEHPELQPLKRSFSRFDFPQELGLFGSLAWEILTGESYRTAASDLDLICDVRTPEEMENCLNWFAQAARSVPCRLDGEIRIQNNWAVNWRELAQIQLQPDISVLGKNGTSVALVKGPDLWSDRVPDLRSDRVPDLRSDFQTASENNNELTRA